MQSASPAGTQRPTQSQRRQQTSADQMQASAPAMNPPFSEGSQVRSSSGSGRSQRTANPDKQISQIEKSVTHLLVATKQLLETLTQWSRGQAQEEEVSDVYVRLGYEFNLACRAFNSIGVETSDLGPVPDLLRSILEDTLSQPASPQALDNYLPRIRDIIINLLHGLKRKQSRLRGRATKDPTATPQPRPPVGQVRQTSVSTTGSSETGLTHMLDDVPSATSSMRGPTPQQDNIAATEYAPANASAAKASKPSINRQSLRKDATLQLPQSETSSTMSSNTAQNLPVLPPYQDAEQAPPAPHINFPHPPPPPPKQTDALARLQRGGDLERRASRRFSAYQIQKHLGASPNGVPVIPAAQNSPIPNRGKEVRESLTAVRSRSSYNQSRSRSARQGDISPSRSGTVRAPQRISEEREETPVLSLESAPQMKPSEGPVDIDSPTVKTPDEYFRHPPDRQGTGSSDKVSLGATVNGPLEPPPEELQETASIDSQPAPPPSEHEASVDEAAVSSPETVQHKTRTNVTPTQSQVMTLDSSPPHGKELTLFLQYRSKIKKFVLADGYEELTIPRLQLAFIEKFAWNTQHDGGELPEIYVQDQVSGVRHELEDLSDVKDRSVLVLNVEQLDEVKKHIDEGLGGLQKSLEGVRALLEGQSTMMQRFSDRQLETSKEMARMSAVPASASRTPTLTPGTFTASAAPTSSTLQEIQNLRREIAVLRQTYSTMSSDFTAAMNDIKSKAAGVKVAAAEAANAAYKGDAGRSHINQGKKTLSNDSEALVNRVDDLSDIVEELRKDVVTRGVRPLPRQLEDISKEISATAKQLTKVKDFVKREKPVWTKIWEQELQIVMTERDDLTQQDELMNDLDGDLEDITNVFKLVEEATKQQNIQNTTTAGRNPSRSLAFDTEVDPHEAKTGMLDEVRALQPNHESRLEAIERAERVRQRELQTRKVGEFQREVEKFVEEGKLKKTGGMDEVERRRKTRDEQARKENWERQQARAAELEKKRAEEAAAAAAAAASSNQTNGTTQESENDTSQEGEAAFQDANEESVLSPEEDRSPAPPAVPAKDEADGGDPPVPQLPELNVDEGEKGLVPALAATEQANGDSKMDGTRADPEGNGHEQPKSDDKKDNRGSWWQPAVFSP